MDRGLWARIGRAGFSLAGFSKGIGPLFFRWCSRARSGWLSTPRKRRRSGWPWRANLFLPPRRGSHETALAPDVILAGGTSTIGPLLQATRTVPIVFTIANDPVGAGFVDSLARPGGNATGFMSWEFSIGGKWLELLKQIAPGVTRVAVLRDAAQGFAVSTFGAMQNAAPSLGGEGGPGHMRGASGI